MKDKWMIPVLLFLVLIVCNVVRGFFQTRITLEMLQTDKIEESYTGKGVLIKNEFCVSLPVGGATEIVASDGERVAKGEMLAMVYSGTADETTRIQLADINKRIAAMEESNAGESVFINDATKIESEIAADVDSVIAKVATKDMETLSQYKYRISNMADQKAVAKGEKETFSTDLTQLRSEKSVLEATLGKIDTAAAADFPGIFIEGHDGFEKALTAESVLSMTPDKVTKIINHEKNGEVVQPEEGTYAYKITDNYSYFVAQNIESSFCTMKVGDSVQIRFSDFSVVAVPAKVVHISEANEKEEKTVVAECNKYVEDLLKNRVANVEFIKKSVSGYKVETRYLHTEDDSVGLYIKRGAVMKFIPVNVVYSTEHEAIVSSADNNRPIKAYDEVVTSAPSFANGKVIVSQ